MYIPEWALKLILTSFGSLLTLLIIGFTKVIYEQVKLKSKFEEEIKTRVALMEAAEKSSDFKFCYHHNDSFNRVHLRIDDLTEKIDEMAVTFNKGVQEIKEQIGEFKGILRGMK